jgi:hypothetical protein
MFRSAFGHLGGLCEFQTAFFAVASKQPEHRVGMRGKRGQRFVDCDRQRDKFLEVLMVRCPLLRLLPQICNRIVVWRRRRQGMCREARGMRGKKLFGRLAGVISCPIMDEQEGPGGVRQDHGQDRLGAFRGEPALDARREQPSGERRNGAKDLVAFALATGFARGLPAALGPRGTSCAPLGKTGLLFTQAHTLAALRSAQDRWPCLLKPRLAPRFVAMVRHETRLWE